MSIVKCLALVGWDFFFVCSTHTLAVLMVLCVYLKDSVMEGMCVAHINSLTHINIFRRKVCICISAF